MIRILALVVLALAPAAARNSNWPAIGRNLLYQVSPCNNSPNCCTDTKGATFNAYNDCEEAYKRKGPVNNPDNGERFSSTCFEVQCPSSTSGKSRTLSIPTTTDSKCKYSNVVLYNRDTKTCATVKDKVPATIECDKVYEVYVKQGNIPGNTLKALIGSLDSATCNPDVQGSKVPGNGAVDQCDWCYANPSNNGFKIYIPCDGSASPNSPPIKFKPTNPCTPGNQDVCQKTSLIGPDCQTCKTYEYYGPEHICAPTPEGKNAICNPPAKCVNVTGSSIETRCPPRTIIEDGETACNPDESQEGTFCNPLDVCVAGGDCPENIIADVPATSCSVSEDADTSALTECQKLQCVGGKCLKASAVGAKCETTCKQGTLSDEAFLLACGCDDPDKYECNNQGQCELTKAQGSEVVCRQSMGCCDEPDKCPGGTVTACVDKKVNVGTVCLEQPAALKDLGTVCTDCEYTCDGVSDDCNKSCSDTS